VGCGYGSPVRRLTRDLQCLIFSLISLHFKIKPI
jgi:hypothetical protein